MFFKKAYNLAKNCVADRRLSLVLSAFAGILGVIPYYCEALFIFTFVSVFLQLYIVFRQKAENGRTYLPFFCYFIGFYTPLYLFLSELYPYERFGFSETQAVFIVICSCILIPLIHSAVNALVFLISKTFPRKSISILGYAALWVVGEWVITLGTLAFPWANIAVSLTGFLPYLQTASLFGKAFITFITVAGCGAFAYSAFNKKRFIALCGAAVIGLNAIAGTIMWFIPTEATDTVKVAALQGNVLSNEKWADRHQSKIYDRYMSLLEEAAKNGAEVILLPESAIPISFSEGGRLHNDFAEIAKSYDVTIVAGITCRENRKLYNSVIAIYPDGSLSERYDKRHLVPFGEFIPFADTIGSLFPFVADFNESSSDFAEGENAVVIDTEKGSITPLVCFDSIFSQFASDGVGNGADMIAVVTNDSWFNDSNGIYTHMRHAQLRAIENKRYVLRAANTGVSAFIDEHGNIVTATEPLTIDTVSSDVAVIQQTTLYTIIGDVFLYISFAIIILFIIYYYIGRIKNGKDATPQN